MKKQWLLIVLSLTVFMATACAAKTSSATSSVNRSVTVKEKQQTVSDIPAEVKQVNIKTEEAKFTYDVDSYPEVVGVADYVFVGEVTEQLETTDDTPEEMKETYGDEVGFEPLSHYKVQVLENLKGSLDTSAPIEIEKRGGFLPDGMTCVMFEKDILPTVGGKYIFMVWATEDGANRVFGPNSTLPLDPNDRGIAKTISLSGEGSAAEEVKGGEDLIAEMKDAIEHQILPTNDLGDFKSKDDVGE